MEIERFWDFSVRTYRTDGVPAACLSLQNDYGADVNMLLYCAWIGAAVGPFEHELFSRANDYSLRWAKNIVIPLREARTWMKHTGCGAQPTPTAECMQLREDVKSVEFAAEKMQQEVLGSMVQVDQARSDNPERIVADVAANLLRYLESIQVQPEVDVRNKLTVIVRAAFPAIDGQTVSLAFQD
jgi:uncharacterized protein (TIGR02444 family)